MHLIIAFIVQARIKCHSSSTNDGQRTYITKPKLLFSNLGGKQFVNICDFIFPKEYTFDQITVDLCLEMADVHNMILRYISTFFALLVSDPFISHLSYEQFILLLKNKYINAPNEDIVLQGLENWITGNQHFRMQALEYEQNRTSDDNGKAYKQLQELVDNNVINWPALSIRQIVKIIVKPAGNLK